MMIAAAFFAVLAVVCWLMVVNTGPGMLFAVAVASTTCTTLAPLGLIVIAVWVARH